MLKSNKKSASQGKSIYMDYASATPIDDSVLRESVRISKKYFANASAIHSRGMEAKKLLEESRVGVAKVLNAHADEIIFTSGSTEANNLAIGGVINSSKKLSKKNMFVPHVITTNIEHASVLELCKFLKDSKKIEATLVPVESNGIVDPKKIKKAFKANTVMVSVMYANNEIGTIQPIREIAKEIRYFNKINSGNDFPKVLLHTDATQAVNYLEINVEKLGIDLLSFNAGKIYGPKGVGVLYKKRNLSLSPVFYGGDQEFGVRPGTENVVSAASLLKALIATERMKAKEAKRLASLRDVFIDKLKKLNGKIIINGDRVNRLPNNINITIPKIPSDLLVIELSAKGVMASAKSACKSGDGKSSHVVRAINPTLEDTDGSLRFSLGRGTTSKDIDYVVKVLRDVLSKLEKWYY